MATEEDEVVAGREPAVPPVGGTPAAFVWSEAATLGVGGGGETALGDGGGGGTFSLSESSEEEASSSAVTGVEATSPASVTRGVPAPECPAKVKEISPSKIPPSVMVEKRI